MKDITALINEASINAKKRNVKFAKNLLLNGKKLGNIGSFVIFTAENPNSQQADKKTNKKLLDALKTELKQAHYESMPIDGYFGNNKEHSLLVFNMKLEAAKEYNGSSWDAESLDQYSVIPLKHSGGIQMYLAKSTGPVYMGVDYGVFGKFRFMTQAAYDALSSYDNDTIYFVRSS